MSGSLEIQPGNINANAKTETQAKDQSMIWNNTKRGSSSQAGYTARSGTGPYLLSDYIGAAVDIVHHRDNDFYYN